MHLRTIELALLGLIVFLASWFGMIEVARVLAERIPV
jgi:hypothetical protein